ncbi:LexA family transcriptional regulator [Allopusillimonas ginsengisoli]|uniref:LexA family transcriptional regulator n=1 Tax=Allopusillimonas ginsengisoli TaxID=453575 RepID=UPI0039C0940E
MNRTREAEELLLADPAAVDTFRTKLAYQLNRKRWKNVDLARKVGVSATSVGKWLKQGNIGKANLLSLSRLFGVPVNYFTDPSVPTELDNDSLVGTVLGKQTEEVKAVQIRDFNLAHGRPSRAKNSLAALVSMMVRKTWLDAHLPANPVYSDLYIYTVQTDAMAPTLSRGDIAVVDVGRRDVAESGLYLVRIMDADDVRRIQINPDASFIVSCDSDLYSSFTVTDPQETTENFEILGQILTPLILRSA